MSARLAAMKLAAHFAIAGDQRLAHEYLARLDGRNVGVVHAAASRRA